MSIAACACSTLVPGCSRAMMERFLTGLRRPRPELRSGMK
jgi:hypothetical protein